jgi:hypothetical protein
LVVHLFDPRLEYCLPSSQPLSRQRRQIHDPVLKQKVDLEITDRKTNPLTQTFSEVWRYAVTNEDSVLRTHDDMLRLRWTYRYEMRYLLELTGFRVRGEFADFKGAPPRYGAEQVWVAEAV